MSMIGDIGKFNWKEAVNTGNGQSSAGLYLAFHYGLVLILLTALAGVAYFIKWIEVDKINNIFIFVGIQMPVVFTYLFGQRAIDKPMPATTKSEMTITQTESKPDGNTN